MGLNSSYLTLPICLTYFINYSLEELHHLGQGACFSLHLFSKRHQSRKGFLFKDSAVTCCNGLLTCRSFFCWSTSSWLALRPLLRLSKVVCQVRVIISEAHKIIDLQLLESLSLYQNLLLNLLRRKEHRIEDAV